MPYRAFPSLATCMTAGAFPTAPTQQQPLHERAHHIDERRPMWTGGVSTAAQSLAIADIVKSPHLAWDRQDTQIGRVQLQRSGYDQKSVRPTSK
jgi:hypothetical protein